jgi:large subunit ribosomal protein L13
MKNKTLQREKHTVDASGKSLGRLASEIATLLRGKQKPSWQPHIDAGDFVEVENIDQLNITGNKAEQKMYYRHSEYPGGLKEASYATRVQNEGHSAVLSDAVYNMLPDNRLRQHMMKRLTFKKSE